MNLQTKRLLLKPVSMEWLEEIHQLHSLREIDRFNTLGIPESLDTTLIVVADWIEKREAGLAYIFIVTLADTGDFIGLAGLKMGKPTYRLAEVWYKTHPVYWQQGYTTEAVHEMIRFGFLELNLHRIEAGCAVANLASIRVLEKVNMKREGHKRELLPIRGSWVDTYIYSILEKEFR